MAPASSKEIIETEVVKQLLISYLGVVKKNVIDLVIKAIVVFLIDNSIKNAHQELVSTIYINKEFESFMVEDRAVTKKRDDCAHVVEYLQTSIQ